MSLVMEAFVHVLLVETQSFNLSLHFTVRFDTLLDCQHVSVRRTEFLGTVLFSVFIQNCSLLGEVLLEGFLEEKWIGCSAEGEKSIRYLPNCEDDQRSSRGELLPQIINFMSSLGVN
jgi:hypothetical protein